MATAPGRPGEQNPAYAPPSAHPEYEVKEPEELILPREVGGVPGGAGGGGSREVVGGQPAKPEGVKTSMPCHAGESARPTQVTGD